MAIVRSNKYNDPAIGAIFENIAGMFAPPSAGDTVNYAQANEINQKIGIIEKLKSDPRYAGADGGVLAGLFNPTQSFYAQDQNNATAVRGQDVLATTSRMNNAADNQRSFVTDMFQPLAQGEVRPDVPLDITSLFDVPGALPQAAGAAKPLSETEARGALIQQAPALNDQQLIALAMGNTPTANVVGADGKPVVSYESDAVGKEPYFNKGAEAKGELYNYVAPTGEEGTAVFDGANIVDAITKQPLPEGVKVYKASAQGTTDQIGMGTNSNRTDAQRLRASVSNADALVNQLEQIVVDHPAATGLAGNVMSFVQDSGQVIKELTTTFGDGPITPDQMRSVTEKIDQVTGGKYEPAYRQANALILELAYANASMNNPSGEVSMQALAREVDALGQGMMGNDQGLLGVLSITRDRMKRKLVQADVLDGTTAAPTPDQIGQPTNEPARPVSDADYEALPSGALFVDPDDGQTYRKP